MTRINGARVLAGGLAAGVVMNAGEAALHGGGPALVGAPGMIPGVPMTPAADGEYVSFFGTGFGGFVLPLEAGEIAGVKYPELNGQVRLANPVSFEIDGIAVPPEDIYYAGAAPCCAGVQQFVVRVSPQARTGNLRVRATVKGRSTPLGPFIAVQRQN